MERDLIEGVFRLQIGLSLCASVPPCLYGEESGKDDHYRTVQCGPGCLRNINDHQSATERATESEGGYKKDDQIVFIYDQIIKDAMITHQTASIHHRNTIID